MIIELQRQWVPTTEDDPLGACGVCGNTLEDVSVLAFAATDDGADMGEVCIECVEYLGRRGSPSGARFPTIEEYRELLSRYPEPMYPNMHEVERSGEEAGYEDPYDMAAERSWVWTVERHRACSEVEEILKGSGPVIIDKGHEMPVYSKRKEE